MYDPSQALAALYQSTKRTKLAASRSVKMMRQMASQGNMSGVQDMAKQLHAGGALKISGPGTNLSRLGTGAEAIADTVVGAKAHPMPAVRKTYDQHSPLYSPELISNKVNAMRQIRNRPGLSEGFAQLHGGLGKGPTGGRYTIQEHIAGQGANIGDEGRKYMESALSNYKDFPLSNPNAGNPQTARFAKRQKIQMNDIFNDRSTDMESMVPRVGQPRIKDLHAGNVKLDPQGHVKIIDFLAPSAHRANEAQHNELQLLKKLSPNQNIRNQQVAQNEAKRYGHNAGASATTSEGHYLTGPHTGIGHEQVMRGLGPGSPRAPGATRVRQRVPNPVENKVLAEQAANAKTTAYVPPGLRPTMRAIPPDEQRTMLR